jgi:hypothetical protein
MTARLNRFRPTLETLEGRDVPSAHLADSLMLPEVPVGDTNHVSVQQSVSDVAPGELSAVPFNTDKVVKYVVDTFKEKVFNDGHNAWGIKSVALIGSEASENTLWVKMHLEFNPGWFTTDPPADLAIKFSYHTSRRYNPDHKWFLCEGTSVTVNGKRDFSHMGMETATCWVLGAFDDPSAKVEGQAADRLAAPYNPERVADSVYQQFNREFVNNGVNVWGLRSASYEGMCVNGDEMQVGIKLAFADGKTATLGINLHYDGRVFGSDVFHCNGTGVVRDGRVINDYWPLQVATQARFLVTTVPASTQASPEMSFAAQMLAGSARLP